LKDVVKDVVKEFSVVKYFMNFYKLKYFLINKLNLKFNYKYFTFINFLVTYFAKNKHRFFLKKGKTKI
jgi:hypothetical protein